MNLTTDLERQHRQNAENLGQHLDYMASQVAPQTTAEDMEAALQEALEHVLGNREGAVGQTIVFCGLPPGH